MQWHRIHHTDDPELDRLAGEYNLHPLHVEDCRTRNQRAKEEWQNDYLFVVLKSVQMTSAGGLETGDVDFFVGSDFLITVEESSCEAVKETVDKTKSLNKDQRPDQILHRLMDGIVDSYAPILDKLSETIDEMEDRALTEVSSKLLQEIFDLKRAFIQIRRVLANTRDVLAHILREGYPVIQPDMLPFFRDIYDHLIRNLDTVEVYRDLLTGATELYLSSSANRTNQVMKVLTIAGTLATPALVVTGIYGMNLQHLPFSENPHSFAIVVGLIFGTSALTMAVLRFFRSI